MDWNNANERKPKSGKLVLVYTPEQTILREHVLTGKYWKDSNDWTVVDFERMEDLIVTHWMPLPEKPKN